ncbi:MAG: M14 family metallopeptidase [Anaerolineae bacterium]|nr:M14 family metallopeptidase [Anaerolineae bacterium]NUQ02436.1 carboxypeptidase [Anaerolineae bacterium]
MPQLTFDHYFRYDELTGLLRAYADEYPHLVELTTIGSSFEERDIWLAVVTNRQTGAHHEKPAVWVDGNIHASEVSPTHACLNLIDTLVRGYGHDETITHVLDTRTFYICPRVNPDGAELALAEKPRIIRSSTRPYPFDEDALGGLEQQDVDGDGRMLFMRIADANGSWKPHPAEPRLMVRRDPAERGGEYYRIFPEGLVENYDGFLVEPKPPKERLDLNRNFPSQWRQEHEQQGAGPYPTSEPEVRAVVDFIVKHPNITGATTFHTWSGVILRPYGTQSDETFPAEDLWTYQRMGDKGTQITGYPTISVYHDFKYHPKETITGVFDDWMYEHRGVFAWTVELWSPQRKAGLADYKFIDWYREHPLDDDLAMLRWSDEHLGGAGYVGWYPFDHPQLGKVELGGWNYLLAWRNPPLQYLQTEITPFAEWLIWLAALAPRLELLEVTTEALGEDHYKFSAVVQNTGWLPTYVSKKALEKKNVRPVIAEIALPDGAKLVTGKLREELKQLEGRAYDASAATPWSISGARTDDRAKVEWIVRVPEGASVTLTLKHERAGVVRAVIRASDAAQ